jgi:hypothetical protein
MEAPDFVSVFRPEKRSAPAELKLAGKLRIENGRITLADPLCAPQNDGPVYRLDLRIPSGTWTVTHAIGASLATDTTHVALTCLQRQSGPVPVSWEIGGEFSVDSGIACLASTPLWDARAAALRLKVQARLTGAAPKSVFKYPGAKDCGLIAFHPGYGDGTYPVWLGRDAQGSLAWIVLDQAPLLDSARPVVTELLFPVPGRGEIRNPDLQRCGLTVEFLEVWKSRPYDRGKAVSLRIGENPGHSGTLKEICLVDRRGAGLPIESESLQTTDRAQYANYLLLRSPEPLPAGAQLCIRLLEVR